VKFGVQVAVAVGLYVSGVKVNLGWLPDWLNLLLSIVWIVGITNAINLLDNMDGLSAGISAVAAAFFMVISAMNDQYFVASLAAAVLGACIGFLFFNTKPASVFMGDAGSLFLGLMLAVLGVKLRFLQNSNFVT
jgi:UDP-GlcNAc:undecaprenyl-phosphate GlcNAc-1-phosphate transferase